MGGFSLRVFSEALVDLRLAPAPSFTKAAMNGASSPAPAITSPTCKFESNLEHSMKDDMYPVIIRFHLHRVLD